MSILFDRLLTISSYIERYEKDRVVCHFKLGSGIFTTATVNNIGPSTSSTSSQDSFHSTTISLVQHPKPGTERCTDVFDPVRSSMSRKTAALLSYYTEMLISGDDISNNVIAYAISVISAAIKHLDPSQVPVVMVDQPLFALGKAVGSAYDEDRVVVMLGGLHIEMAAFNLARGFLEVGRQTR